MMIMDTLRTSKHLPAMASESRVIPRKIGLNNWLLTSSLVSHLHPINTDDSWKRKCPLSLFESRNT